MAKYDSYEKVGTIKKVIDSPEYVGCHPNKVGKGIELIKKLSDNIIVGIEFDVQDNYIYVSTLHPIKQAKIMTHLNSNRIKPF